MLGRLFFVFVVSSFSLVSLAEDSCTFSRRDSAIGDVANQTVTCDLKLEMAIRQGEQVVDSNKQEIQRTQKRQLKILSIGELAPTKALVHYVSSEVTLKQANAEPSKSNQPVAGKSYLVSREDGKLVITDSKGNSPPEEELNIVRANLEAFGLPNPIAKFFNGRTLKVGETVKLPIEIAKELLGFQDAVGDVTGLEMKLLAIRELNKKSAAVFETNLLAKDSKPNGINLKLKGQMAIEVSTCRTLAVNLAGPVSIEELHGPPNGQFAVTSDGELKVAVRAAYSTTRR